MVGGFAIVGGPVDSMLFKDDAAHTLRQPKTDRLILPRYLAEAIRSPEIFPVQQGQVRVMTAEVRAAHEILIKWADLERSGQLGRMNENQLQGEFFADIFGRALGYRLFSEGAGTWTLEQHHTIAGTQPDAVLGEFTSGREHEPMAVVELKGPRVHLDRDRSDGRTAVQQLWQYLVNTERTCRWGIVSNLVSFRLYERDSTQRRYEHFSLQQLRNQSDFLEFYCLFHAKGLVEKTAGRPPRAIELLKRSNDRQREVSDELYDRYSQHRTLLIDHLHREQGYAVPEAIEIVQRLLDRVIFVAFCEDRGLLREETIRRAYSELPAFYAVTNPRWQNFKALFRFLDEGNEAQGVPGYNGGLFAESPADDIELDDKWTHFFNTLGGYDFADEINLDVLGHLFEKSITELEKLRSSALFEGGQEQVEQYARMPQSIKRKQLGIYYTPQELTSRIVQYTVDELIEERLEALKPSPPGRGAGDERDDSLSAEYWEAAIGMIRRLKIVDPACGSGAFLFQAYEALEHRYHEAIGHLDDAGEHDRAREHARNVASYILNDNLYGVDLSPEAVEITQLALWIRSAVPGQTLATLSKNIVHGNSLVHDSEVHSAGFDWRERFPEVFDREENGFDCVIGNPPWERMDLSEREHFSIIAPEIATATTGAKRKRLIAKLEGDNPEIYARYVEAKAGIDAQRAYCRDSGEYPLTGRGRTNTYAVFAELASQIVAPQGRVGLLVPSGIAMQDTTKLFFQAISETHRLRRLYEFDNRRGGFFADVHHDTQFVILNFGGARVKCDEPDFSFGMFDVDDLEDRSRHLVLTGEDIRLLNPNTRTCPTFSTKRDAELTKDIYRRVPVLVDKARERTGNAWELTFRQGLFNQTSDSEVFLEPSELQEAGYGLEGNRWATDESVCLPLYEAKMMQAYDHRYASAYTDITNWVNQGQTSETTLVEHQNPEYLIQPRWWVKEAVVRSASGEHGPPWLGFRDVTNPTNMRTMIACFMPDAAFTNKVILLRLPESIGLRRRCGLLACFNSFCFDYMVRQKMLGRNLNFYIVEQLPTLTPDTYDKPCPWEKGQTLETWISERVLKLSCTAEDMLPLAEACSFTGGSFQSEYGGRLHKWDPADRANLMAELDAAYFILYGIERDDAEYILSTFSGVVDPNPLLPGHRSTAEHILETYDMYRMQSMRG